MSELTEKAQDVRANLGNIGWAHDREFVLALARGFLNAEAERDRLRAESDYWQKRCLDAEEDVCFVNAECGRLREQVERYEEALQEPRRKAEFVMRSYEAGSLDENNMVMALARDVLALAAALAESAPPSAEYDPGTDEHRAGRPSPPIPSPPPEEKP